MYILFSRINNIYNIQISETLRCNHLLKLRYLFSSKLSSISSVMTNFVFGLRISSLFFCSASVSSARFSGRTIIFRGSWYWISILLPSEKTSVVGYVRSYTGLCFLVIAAVQQLRFLRRPVAELPIRVSETIILKQGNISIAYKVIQNKFILCLQDTRRFQSSSD